MTGVPIYPALKGSVPYRGNKRRCYMEQQLQLILRMSESSGPARTMDREVLDEVHLPESILVFRKEAYRSRQAITRHSRKRRGRDHR